jgi:quinol-cytochrome oxidoreductase complex cytochrome b subunit
MPPLGEIIRESQIWKSIIRHPAPVDRRNRVVVMLTNFFLHLHPVSIKKQGIALSFTWCMGGLTFFLFLVETITGLLLMFYYRPTAEYAYHDIVYLRADVALGTMREIHRWGAHAMVITVWLHMYRVFLTGSYKPPREFNWVVGVILLLLTLLLSFTGYLLPWDQLAIWAITVGSNMARATPFLGYEGPGNQLLTINGIDMITNASDARFGLLRALRRRRNAQPILRFALRRDSARGRDAARHPFLAGPKRRRNQRTTVRK